MFCSFQSLRLHLFLLNIFFLLGIIEHVLLEGLEYFPPTTSTLLLLLKMQVSTPSSSEALPDHLQPLASQRLLPGLVPDNSTTGSLLVCPSFVSSVTAEMLPSAGPGPNPQNSGWHMHTYTHEQTTPTKKATQKYLCQFFNVREKKVHQHPLRTSSNHLQ